MKQKYFTIVGVLAVLLSQAAVASEYICTQDLETEMGVQRVLDASRLVLTISKNATNDANTSHLCNLGRSAGAWSKAVESYGTAPCNLTRDAIGAIQVKTLDDELKGSIDMDSRTRVETSRGTEIHYRGEMILRWDNYDNAGNKRSTYKKNIFDCVDSPVKVLNSK